VAKKKRHSDVNVITTNGQVQYSTYQRNVPERPKSKGKSSGSTTATPSSYQSILKQEVSSVSLL